ncbi:MAG: CFI-box-CTERM domain-containing protein [Dysosmobacter welbionis]
MDGSSEKLTGANIKYGDPPGCYIATAVYGSYDCPQVWTLRRFRDHTLAASWYGRTFLHAYYAVSPTLVKWFGRTAWFQKLLAGPPGPAGGKTPGRGRGGHPLSGPGVVTPENKSSPLSNGEDFSVCIAFRPASSLRRPWCR